MSSFSGSYGSEVQKRSRGVGRSGSSVPLIVLIQRNPNMHQNPAVVVVVVIVVVVVVVVLVVVRTLIENKYEEQH